MIEEEAHKTIKQSKNDVNLLKLQKGFNNSNNASCYANASIQCLINIEYLQKVSIKDIVSNNIDSLTPIFNGKCPLCNALNTLVSKTTIQNTKNVLIFSLRLAAPNAKGIYVKDSRCKISAVPQSTLNFSGHSYSLAATIFHHGESLSAGHIIFSETKQMDLGK